jgi:hypothetical protein
LKMIVGSLASDERCCGVMESGFVVLAGPAVAASGVGATRGSGLVFVFPSDLVCD